VSDFLFSGRRIDFDSFVSGWLLPPDKGRRAHFVEQRFPGLIGLCGFAFKGTWVDAAGVVAFEAGSYPKCKRCLAHFGGVA
jgi:hypothetical protein